MPKFVIKDATERVIEHGYEVTNFRGEVHHFDRVTEGPNEFGQFKMMVKERQWEVHGSVYNLHAEFLKAEP